MDKVKGLFKEGWVWMLLFSMLCSVFGVVDGGMLAANATVTPANGGAIGIDEVTSVTRTNEDSERLLLDYIEKNVTKIRPHDVILDTISRWPSNTRNVDSQVIRHYAIDVLDLNALTTAAVVANNDTQKELFTSDDAIFAIDQTVICDGVPGYKEDGVTIDTENDLMLYVIGVSSNNHPLVIPVNGRIVTGNMLFPAIPVNTVLIRAGRAGAESQISTDPYSGIPTDFRLYLQKFMTQIEETTLFKIRDKEVDWTFSDKEEEAVFDMRRVMNVTFWRGVQRMIKFKNSRTKKSEEIYFTGGVWNQAGKEFSFGGSTITHNNIVSMMKAAFTGNASSKRKVFIVGSDLLEMF